MATLYWKGGAGSDDDDYGDFNNASNWQTATGGAGSVPTSSDVIVFDGRAATVPSDYSGTKHTAGKHYNCYHNMASGPDDCQGVVIASDFTGRIGITSDDIEGALQLSVASGKRIIYQGDEPCLLKIKTASKTVPAVVHNSTSGLLKISGVNDTNAIWELIELFGGGTLEIEDDTKVTDIYNFGTATITIGEDCPACSIYQYGGSFTADSPLTLLELYGGTAAFGSLLTEAPSAASIDLATLKLWGGNFTWRAPGKITDCTMHGGTITVTGTGDKTIGNASETWKLYGGTFDATAQAGNLTLTSGCAILVKGGSLDLPNGTKITAFTTGN